MAFRQLQTLFFLQWTIAIAAATLTGVKLPNFRIANNNGETIGKYDNGTLGPALETVHLFKDQFPTGVTVTSDNRRIFVNYPRWFGTDDDPLGGVKFTVAEIKDGNEVPYPNQEINWPGEGKKFEDKDLTEYFVSVQSVVLDGQDRLWVLDTGRPYLNYEQPPSKYGGPKLIGIDIETNQIFKKIIFPRDIVLPTSYPNDIRLDLSRGPLGTAYITDSSPDTPALITLDLHTNKFLRRLSSHPSTQPVMGFVPSFNGIPIYQRIPSKPPTNVAFGADGIALSANKSSIIYTPLSSRNFYSVPTDLLANPDVSDEEVGKAVKDFGDKGSSSDGFETDDKGVVYLSAGEQNGIYVFDGETGLVEPFVRDPRIQWPDTLSVADGWLYFTSNEFFWQPQYWNGEDKRVLPYALFRVPIGGKKLR
ncbi:hypothetical protein HK097_010330 [Rhizophlyctis rosea]|uniref:Major royal jelly protein n=1 Tax=Rhizophlyctis rosea TaxID=64517 RepID=A0AAD5SAY8_9FUNG|nr:hypothetical protein HK097_010330 [Rhizophlyctis rosea]